MTDATDYLENNLVDNSLGNTNFTPPVNIYLSLHTIATDDTGGGTEVSGNGYAREQIPFAFASGGSSSNSALRGFTASGAAWGLITHCALWDAASGGNMLFHTILNSSVSINDGDTIEFAVSSITVALD